MPKELKEDIEYEEDDLNDGIDEPEKEESTVIEDELAGDSISLADDEPAENKKTSAVPAKIRATHMEMLDLVMKEPVLKTPAYKWKKEVTLHEVIQTDPNLQKLRTQLKKHQKTCELFEKRAAQYAMRIPTVAKMIRMQQKLMKLYVRAEHHKLNAEIVSQWIIRRMKDHEKYLPEHNAKIRAVRKGSSIQKGRS